MQSKMLTSHIRQHLPYKHTRIYRYFRKFSSLRVRDVNFVFFPKIDYHFEKNDFFSIIEFGRHYLAKPRLLCNMPRATRWCQYTVPPELSSEYKLVSRASC